jgi:hypothetical protein
LGDEYPRCCGKFIWNLKENIVSNIAFPWNLVGRYRTNYGSQISYRSSHSLSLQLRTGKNLYVTSLTHFSFWNWLPYLMDFSFYVTQSSSFSLTTFLVHWRFRRRIKLLKRCGEGDFDCLFFFKIKNLVRTQ